jgi:hypothetical protein
MSWIPQGWMKDPLSFLIVLDKHVMKHHALLRPYDAPTWFLLTLSVLAVTGVLTLSLWTYRAHFLQSVRPMDFLLMRNMLLMTLASILEQNPSELTARLEYST